MHLCFKMKPVRNQTYFCLERQIFLQGFFYSKNYKPYMYKKKFYLYYI